MQWFRRYGCFRRGVIYFLKGVSTSSVSKIYVHRTLLANSSGTIHQNVHIYTFSDSPSRSLSSSFWLSLIGAVVPEILAFIHGKSARKSGKYREKWATLFTTNYFIAHLIKSVKNLHFPIPLFIIFIIVFEWAWSVQWFRKYWHFYMASQREKVEKSEKLGKFT